MSLIYSITSTITRNIEDKKGWTFSIDLEQENIEIKRVDAQIGTKVVIELTDKTIKQLDEPARWDCCKWNEWYVDANPCVTNYVDGIKLYQVKEEKKIDKELAHEVKKELKDEYKAYKEDEKEAKKFAKNLDKDLKEMEKEDREEQKEYRGTRKNHR